MGKSGNEERDFVERQLPRLSVPVDLPLKVEVVDSDETPWPARCLNIHLAGILLEFTTDKIPLLAIDSKVLITIQFNREIAVKIPAIVRHSVAGQLGLYFPDLATHAPEKEDQLSRIIRTVEREILRRKNL